jgi:hypothetical protein
MASTTLIFLKLARAQGSFVDTVWTELLKIG